MRIFNSRLEQSQSWTVWKVAFNNTCYRTYCIKWSAGSQGDFNSSDCREAAVLHCSMVLISKLSKGNFKSGSILDVFFV